MSAQFDDIEKQARSLPLKEKAALARVLIEDLDTSVDEDVEQLWIQEAQRRYAAYLKGDIEALPGEDVMRRARERLK
jgi:putative addiction module component (TIGR02574 family)